MALFTVNKNYNSGSYESDRDIEIKRFENDPLRVKGAPLGVDFDHEGNAVIGYGFDLFVRNADVVAAQLNGLLGNMATVTQRHQDVLTSFRDGVALNRPGDQGKRMNIIPEFVS